MGKEHELARREPLLKALAALKGADRESRTRAALVGEALAGYEALFKLHKRDGGPVRNFRVVLAALGVSKSKAYRCRTAFKVAAITGMLDAGDARGIDLSEQRHAKLANRLIVESKVQHMEPDELFAYCVESIESERKAGEAPRTTKVAAPIPIQIAGEVDYESQIANLREQFRSSYATDAEGDKVFNQVIIAAATAQLGKLPARRAA